MPVSGRDKIALADAMTLHYLEETAYGNKRIDPLSAKFLEFFGEQRISYYPMDPLKKVRDLVLGLEDEEVLKLCAYVSKDEPYLEEKLNAVLRTSGFQLEGGKVVAGAEHELELMEEDKAFSSFLDSLGLGPHLALIKAALSDLHAGRIHPACSQMCLALEGVLKSALTWRGTVVPKKATLGTLVGLARGDIIEEEAETLFRGFVRLRNLPPQHARMGGSVAAISDELALLLAHSGRALIAYLAERIQKTGLSPSTP